MWDMHGLECLFSLSEWEKLLVWNILKDVPPPIAPNPKMLIMRAMANSQRKYEIYIFETDGLDEGIVRSSFEQTPQFMADFIRKNGYRLYSYSEDSNEVVIK